jgi:hypothetical protein
MEQVHENTAQRFWQDTMSQHPQISGWFALMKSGIGFFTNGYVIVAFGHWLVSFCGRIAETAMLLSVLWITSVFIAPNFVLWGLSQAGGDLGVLNTITDFCIMALALLPEVIVFNALVTCIRFWHLAVATPGKRLQYGAWAALHTMPTIAFLGMTIWTMWTFIHGHAHLDQAAISLIENARSQGLTIRVFAGWFFCLTSVVYARLGKQLYEGRRDERASVPASPAPQAGEVAQLTQHITKLDLQMQTLQKTIEQLQQLESTTEMQPQERHTDVLNLAAIQLENAPVQPVSVDAHVLKAYPAIGREWLAKGITSVSIEDIIAATDLTRQKLAYHAKNTFVEVPEQPAHYTVASVLKWLATSQKKTRNVAPRAGSQPHKAKVQQLA